MLRQSVSPPRSIKRLADVAQRQKLTAAVELVYARIATRAEIEDAMALIEKLETDYKKSHGRVFRIGLSIHVELERVHLRRLIRRESGRRARWSASGANSTRPT